LITTFYIIRHGETDWNVEGRWQGWTDIPLNTVGVEQAHVLAARLEREGVGFDAIYSSDLQRAWVTADVVGAHLGLAPRPLVALREIDLGRWGGLTREQIEVTDGETLARLNAGEDVPRGGAERMADLMARTTAALEQLLVEHRGQTVALFSHGGTVRALLRYADRLDPMIHQHIGNTAVSIITHDGVSWHVQRVNDLTHLVESEHAQKLMPVEPAGDQEVAFESDTEGAESNRDR
jgi:probable phosphoglycerate mutase